MPLAKLPNGITIRWESAGEGEPVLLLMGTGADHSLWASQVPAYSERHRVLTIDSRGTGKSTRPKDPTTCTPYAMAEDAKLLLDHLGIGKVHLGGLSLGSAIAQEFALAWPDRLLSLALHGTWGRSDEWFKRMIDTLEYPAARGDVEAYLRFGLMWVLSPRFLEERPEDVAAIERTYLLENPDPPSGEGICNHTHADKVHDALCRLHLITARTLVTAGEMDWIVPPRYGEEVAVRIPGARYHLFRGDFASHVANIEMAEEWNRVTLDFMAGREVGVALGSGPRGG
jgi:pimeloyl-ACP methyl ester carboxylesterase